MLNEHPDLATLKRLIRGELDDVEVSSIEAHVESCGSICQPLLDQLLAETRDNALHLAENDKPLQISGYFDFSEIGRGGMGVVYKATHLALNRTVAAKVLKPGLSSANASRLALRFRKEAQITGQLQHPSIPPVHDLGTTEDGRPFMVMKLIKGNTLDTLIQTKPQTRESLRELLDLFEKVCEGVAYAHSRGIVHRDLKPQNVMVGSFGTVSVLDWGLAKQIGTDLVPKNDDHESLSDEATEISTDPLLETNTLSGALMGSPQYMSPEQAGGEWHRVDQRTDVFGLGAILCCILTGEPPYRGKGREELRLQAIRHDINDAINRLNSSEAYPEVIALAKRCLAELPENRPANAQELVDELVRLRRTTEDRLKLAELSAARAETRRRAMAWGSSIVGLVLVLGLIGTSIGFYNADQALKKADKAEAEVLSQLEKTEKARQRAEAKEAEVASMLSFVEDSIIARPRPTNDLSTGGRSTRIIDALLLCSRDIDQHLADKPMVEAKVRFMVAETLFNLSEKTVSAEHYNKAYMILKENLGADDEETVLCGMRLANALKDSDPEKALALQTSLIETAKGSKSLQERLIELQWNQANSLERLGKIAEAEDLRASVATRINEAGDSLRRLFLNLQIVEEPKLTNRGEALEYVDKLRSQLEELEKLESFTSQIVMARTRLAYLQSELGRFQEAEADLKRTVENGLKALGPDNYLVLDAMQALSLHYERVGKYGEAKDLAVEYNPRLRRSLGDQDEHFWQSQINLGGIYFRLAQYDQALETWEETYSLVLKQKERSDPLALSVLDNISLAQAASGNLDKATETKNELLVISASLPKTDPKRTQIINNAAMFFLRKGDDSEARRLFQEAYDLRKQYHGEYEPDTLLSLSGLAQCAYRSKDHEEAIRMAKVCIDHAGTQAVNIRMLPEMGRLLFDVAVDRNDLNSCEATIRYLEQVENKTEVFEATLKDLKTRYQQMTLTVDGKAKTDQ